MPRVLGYCWVCIFIFVEIGFAQTDVKLSKTKVNPCSAGSHWVRAHFRRAYTRADGKSFRATQVSAHCSANPSGYDFWDPKLKDLLPSGWPRKGEIGRRWSQEERERVLEALGFLPANFRSSNLQGIFRGSHSLDFSNQATSDHRGNIVLYDNAFNRSENLTQILAHELAHRAFDDLSATDASDYRTTAKWVDISESGTPDWLSYGRKFVLPDGVTSPEEDFANNVEYFLFNSKKLEEVSPEAFSWIKKHFGASFKLGKGSP